MWAVCREFLCSWLALVEVSTLLKPGHARFRVPAQLSLTSSKLFLGFWTGGLASCNLSSLETSYLQLYILKNCSWSTLYWKAEKIQNCKNKQGWFGEQLIKWSVSPAFLCSFENLISVGSKKEGKVGVFLQQELAFTFQSVLKDTNEAFCSFIFFVQLFHHMIQKLV